jgi:O-methyltransferase
VSDIRARYLELLKRSLLGELYIDDVLRIFYLRDCLAGEAAFDSSIFANVRDHQPDRISKIENARSAGWPYNLDFDTLVAQHTMIGRTRLDHVERCFHAVIDDGVPGDFMECGVWRGGVVVFLRALLEVFEVPDRVVWAADSFEGLPPPTSPVDVASFNRLSKDCCPMLAISSAEVRRTIESYDLFDQRVRLVPGWFRSSLSQAPVQKLALLRLDADMYESTRDALQALYHRVSPGGICIVDDYWVPACRQAVDEFRAVHGIRETLEVVDLAAVAWRKER